MALGFNCKGKEKIKILYLCVNSLKFNNHEVDPHHQHQRAC